MKLGNCIDECRLVLDGGDAIQFRFERFAALGVSGFLVHAGTVEIADFLGNRVPRRGSNRSLIQDVAHGVLVALVQFVKADPRGLVSGNLRVLDPVAARVLIEISAGIDSLIYIVDAETLRRLSLGGSSGCRLSSAEGERKQNESDNLKRTHRDLSRSRRRKSETESRNETGLHS